MPSIDTAAGYSRNKNSDNGSNNYGSSTSRPSLTWNGMNGNGIPTWGSSRQAGKNSHYSQPLNGNNNNNNGRIYGNGGPITTVLAPPKHPCLINLDPLGTSFFQYPLLPGVTMLGTGRGCPKPPDLVLHGSGIEPQHCFIERNPIDDEVILHPICERTTVDDVPIFGPTPLVPGNMVTVGGSHTFRFDGPASKSSSNNNNQHAAAAATSPTKNVEDEQHGDTGILQRLQMLKQQKIRQQEQMKCEKEESHYAIINPGAGNPLRSAGDVNKNSFHGMKIMDPLLTLEQTFSNRPERSPQESDDALRRDIRGAGGGFDKTPDRYYSSSVSNNGNRNNNGAGNNYNNHNNACQSNELFPSDSYVNHQPHQHNLLTRNEFESRRMMFGGGDSSSRTTTTSASSANNFNNNNYNGHHSNGFNLQNSERKLSASGLSNSYAIEKSELSKCFDRQDSGRSNYYYCSTPVRDVSMSSPLSFSSYGSGSGLPSSVEISSRQINNDSPDSFNCRTHTTSDGQYLRDEAIACETLLEIKRKQAYEARVAADVTQQSEKLRLEEILAMCAEYEEQIAKEIKENTPPNNNNSQSSMHQGQTAGFSARPLTSSTTSSSSNNSVSTAQSVRSVVTPPDKPTTEATTTPKSPTLYGYSRIKTNGSLPRDKKSTTSEGSRCYSNNSSAFADEEIASIFTFSPTIGIPNDVFLPNSSDNSTSIPTLSANSASVYHHRKPDEPDGSLIQPKDGFRSNIKSPYENVANGNVEEATITTANPPQSPRTRIRTTLGRVPNDGIYSSIRRPIITTVVDSQQNKLLSSPPPPPPPVASEITKSPADKPRGKSPTKSKLTVTFSSSIPDIHDESEREERTNVSKSDPTSPLCNKDQEVKYATPPSVIATQVQVHVEGDETRNIKQSTEYHVNACVNVPSLQSADISTGNNNASSVSSASPDSSKSETSRIFPVVITESRAEVLKKNISEVEQQEMEAIREMEIEKALLLGEENSLESQIAARTKESKELKAKLERVDESNRQWRAESLEHIANLKVKLNSSEKELERLEKIQDNFEGNTDEETSLLEQLKHQHELVEIDRKAFEDAEFYHMEEEINREGQRDELSKIVSELDRKVLAGRGELEQLQSQNRISFTSSAREVHKLEHKRQELIQELRQLRETTKLDENLLQIPDTTESISDTEDVKNVELEDKLRALSLFSSSTDDVIRIERMKSRSPIDPLMRAMGAKTTETLREIERNREYLLNEQGVQMLEQERQRVRELQKRVQDAVREEWEATRKSRNNQCHSLNSVGSEESTQTISDTPTDSGSGDDTTDTSGAPSVSTTDMSLNTMSGGVSTEKFEQMRQKQRDMSDGYEETTRPLSDGSAYDDGSTIVTMREKHRVQSRPLTRYLPVRGDEERFDLRAFIESSGHQLELCPHIIVTATAARGFLSKLGSRFNNWVKRWFVFDRETRTFSYYIDKGEKKARGGIHFQAIEEVYVDHLQSVKSPQPKLTFCVKTSSRVFHLMAPSPEAMRMWVDIIFTGAEGYQEFRNGTSGV